MPRWKRPIGSPGKATPRYWCAVTAGTPAWWVSSPGGSRSDTTGRPASPGLATGGRRGPSVPGLDLGAAVLAARQMGILTTGGGHPMAAGFSLPPDRLDAFHEFLNGRLAAAAALPSAVDLAIEGALMVPGATADLAREVARLAPFGAGNEEPMFVLQRARVV